jgi:hypothetical protein
MSAATAVVWVLVAALVSATGAVNRSTSLLNTTANSTMDVVAAEHAPQVGGWTPPMRGGAAAVMPVESEKAMASTKDHARRGSATSHAEQQRQPTSGPTSTSTAGLSVTRGSEDDGGGHSADTDTMTTTTTAPGGHGEARVSLTGMSSEGVVVLAIMCLMLTMVRAHMCLLLHTHENTIHVTSCFGSLGVHRTSI